MKAVDTNVLVRWITRDDQEQAWLADMVMSEPVYVAHGVLLELAWVLGGRNYRFDRATLASTLRVLLDTRTIAIPREEGVAWAVSRFEAGADIADMLHIVGAIGTDAFVSFENDLATRAGADTPVPVERPH